MKTLDSGEVTGPVGPVGPVLTGPFLRLLCNAK